MRDIASRNANAAVELQGYQAQKTGSIRVLDLELACQASLERFAALIEREYEWIDGLINNAGVGALGLVEGFSVEQVRQLFEINYFAPLSLINLLLPLLRQSQQAKIINISSVGGRLCFPCLTHYCASKHALEALSEGLSVELQGAGIDVHGIEPVSYPNMTLPTSDSA